MAGSNFLSSIPPLARNITAAVLGTIMLGSGLAFYIQDSSGNSVFRVDESGNVAMSGALSVGGTFSSDTLSGAVVTASGVNLLHVPYVFPLVGSGTAIATGSALPTFDLPFGGRVAWMHCNVDNRSSDSSNLNATINALINSTSIFSTTVTIDGGENDSDTAATAPVINTANNGFSQGDKLNFNLTQVGGGTPAQGLNCRGTIVKESVTITQP